MPTAYATPSASAVMGNVDAAFAGLQNARWDFSSTMNLRASPLLARFRADPRYAALLGTMGLPPYAKGRFQRPLAIHLRFTSTTRCGTARGERAYSPPPAGVDRGVTVRNACIPVISCGSQTISYLPSLNRESITMLVDWPLVVRY